MKILFLTNNAISEPLIAWLGQREVVIIHEGRLRADDVRALQPELIVSYSYRHILNREVLDTRPGRFINLHISLLPFNRGADPNAWSYLEGTPPGVTIHQIDEGIDTGPVLLQQPVAIDETRETLGSSYVRLHQAIQALFVAHWPDLRAGRLVAQPQQAQGTFHRADDFAKISEMLFGAEGWDVPITLLSQRYQRLVRDA